MGQMKFYESIHFKSQIDSKKLVECSIRQLKVMRKCSDQGPVKENVQVELMEQHAPHNFAFTSNSNIRE